MAKRVVLIRHNDGPSDDRVLSFFQARGIEPEQRYPFKGDSLGQVDDSVAASVIYGGPFNVFETDKYPFLLEENRWAEDCMARGVPLLGICQGAQQIAHILGARVGPKPGEPHEFGYYPIYATEAGKAYLPEQLYVAQAHFHEFELPRGAELLAYSETFPTQAMRAGETTFGFQFHPEVTLAGFRRWQDRPGPPSANQAPRAARNRTSSAPRTTRRSTSGSWDSWSACSGRCNAAWSGQSPLIERRLSVDGRPRSR